MNVLITNESEDKLSSLDIDIIKHITGTYSAKELVDMFSTFFYNKMIIDVTALTGNKDINTFKSLAEGLDTEKLILFLPEGSDFCTTDFLSNLVSVGIYNFTTNLEGVKYLIKNSNSYKDVAHIQKLESTGAKPTESATSTVNTNVNNDINMITIGIKNVTPHAGATTLIYMMMKELNAIYGKDNVLALEVEKDDFKYFNMKNMVSTSNNDLRQDITNRPDAKIILIDLNQLTDTTMCNKVIYLLEPSTLQLNRMIDRNKFALDKLKNKTIVLNRSLLSNKDVSDLEYESGLRIFYNMPPLNDRKKNETIVDFLKRINLIQESGIGNNLNKSNKIFGLFRR